MQFLHGMKLYKLTSYKDSRGSFMEIGCNKDNNFVQENQSITFNTHTFKQN